MLLTGATRRAGEQELLVGHESSSKRTQEARYTRGAGLGYDARALKIPGPAKLAAWRTSSVGRCKVTLKRLGQGGMLFIHDITQRDYIV